MATMAEDPSSTLENFIHDSANLPAEISYNLEEMAALDTKLNHPLHQIHIKESAIQKQIKNHGSLVPHPKEQEYTDYAKRHWDPILSHQQKKITFADGAIKVLDGQLKRLDVHLRSLIADGQLGNDPPLPSIFNRPVSTGNNHSLLDAARTPSQANSNLYNNSTYRAGTASTIPLIKQPQPRQTGQITSTDPSRQSIPNLPLSSSNLSQSQSIRETSDGADPKRRKLNITTTGISLPSAAASLRQASADPSNLGRSGTPKAGTPTGTSSRAGSAGPVGRPRGSTNKKGPSHAAISKLKGKHKTHIRLSQSSRKRAGSPSIRGTRGGTAASEDSVLSSAAEDSGTDVSQTAQGPGRGRRRKGAGSSQPEPSHNGGDDAEGEDDPDDTLYCYCNRKSYGEMVACENEESCPHQWFHIDCLGLKSVPTEDKWYCPECRGEKGSAFPSAVVKGRKRERK